MSAIEHSQVHHDGAQKATFEHSKEKTSSNKSTKGLGKADASANNPPHCNQSRKEDARPDILD